MQQHFPIHAERMKGVAAASGCSVLYYPPATTATGHGYFSRNYDFFLGSMAQVMMVPEPPAADPVPAVMSEPHLMQWHPDDGGYARTRSPSGTGSPAGRSGTACTTNRPAALRSASTSARRWTQTEGTGNDAVTT